MGFTFNTLNKGRIVLELPNQEVNITKTYENANDEKQNRKIGSRSKFPIQVIAEVEAAENHDDHEESHAAGVGHLHERFLCLFIHWRGAYNMKTGSSQTKIPYWPRGVEGS